MTAVAICIVSICVIGAALIAITPCVLSSKLSREEEKQNDKRRDFKRP